MCMSQAERKGIARPNDNAASGADILSKIQRRGRRESISGRLITESPAEVMERKLDTLVDEVRVHNNNDKCRKSPRA